MGQRPIVLLTNTIHPDGETILRAHAQVVTAADANADTLRLAIKDVDGVIVRAPLPDDITDHAPRLKGLVRHGVGLDFISVVNATRNGVMVANLPGSNTHAVAEYFFSALFHIRRPLGRIDARLREDGWNSARPLADDSTEIGGTTLGILGLGAIGRRIAQIARGFGMNVLGVARNPIHDEGIRQVSMHDMFSRSDAIAICCSLTDETRGIVNARLIAAMKRTACLVNVARGPVVQTMPLIDALRSGAIAGAATDVYDSHPIPSGAPLFDCPNLLMTPHVAGITASAMRAMSVGAAEEMIRILRGERPHNLVNPECLKR
jgi:D-3-phosphoglycerate dehydrogenase / 2-oxoglutarate reductase